MSTSDIFIFRRTGEVWEVRLKFESKSLGLEAGHFLGMIKKAGKNDFRPYLPDSLPDALKSYNSRDDAAAALIGPNRKTPKPINPPTFGGCP